MSSEFCEFRDRQGNPISLERWSELRSDLSYRRLVISKGYGFTVCTNWLGYNPPEVFETMAFTGDSGAGTDVFQGRYATEEAALQGHARAVRYVKQLHDGIKAEASKLTEPEAPC